MAAMKVTDWCLFLGWHCVCKL